MTVRKNMNINFVRHSWFTWWSLTSTQNWGSHKKEQKKKKDGIVFEDRHQPYCWSWGGEWNKSSAKLIRSLSPGKIGMTRDTIAKSFSRFGHIDVIQTVHFPLNSPPHQLVCMLYVGDKRKILKLIFNKPWWAVLKREPGHLICVPTVVYCKRWQTLDNVQRKFLQFITFIKLKTPYIKKTHQTSFIFSLTLQNMNIALSEKRKSDAIIVLGMRQFQSVSFRLCYWKRMERLSESH